MNPNEALRKALEHIEKNIRAADMRSVAQAAGMSEGQLTSLFRKKRFMTPGEYLLLRRIAHLTYQTIETGRPVAELAPLYGFGNDEFFYTTFRRLTGYPVSEFDTLKPAVHRTQLGAGLYGPGQPGHPLPEADFAAERVSGPESALLYGLPKVEYGSYGGVTPLAICLRACAAYLGSTADYTTALCGSGAAFRLTWNMQEWDAGNVDAKHAFDGASCSAAVYEAAARAMGLSCRLLPEAHTHSKEELKSFILNALGDGMPVVAAGVIGPPEACIVAGCKGGGDVLLGWNLFQEASVPGCDVWFDECGYFVTDTWYENGAETLMAVGPKERASIGPNAAARLAVSVMQPRTDGPYAKGLSAWDAWKEALLSDSFPAEKEALVDPLMCVCDAIDCITDGRYNAAKYFRAYRSRNPLWQEAAAHFDKAYRLGMDMYKALGGWERGEKQLDALADRTVRGELCRLIDAAKEADAAALDCLRKSIE